MCNIIHNQDVSAAVKLLSCWSYELAQKITNYFFGPLLRSRASIFFSIFVSMSCHANNLVDSGSGVLTPECSPYCEKINFLLFSFVDDIKVVSVQQKNIFLSEIKSVFDVRRPNIRVSFVDMDKVARYYQPTTSMVFTEIHLYQDDYNKSIVKIRVTIVAPNRYFSDELICAKSEGFSCISGKFKKEISKNIEDYFFKPSNGRIL